MDTSNLEKALNIFKNNGREVIAFDFNKTEDDNPYTSKLGGTPYLPDNFIYPTIIKNKKIKNLSFMCQFNLQEIYEKVGNSLLPNVGILQFYILSDYCVGEEEDLQNNQLFKVIYHKEINKHNPTKELLEKIKDKKYIKNYGNLIDGIFNMSFAKNIHYLDSTDILSAYQILKGETITHGYACNTLVRHFLPEVCETNYNHNYYNQTDYKKSSEILKMFEESEYEDPHHLFGFAHFQGSDYMEMTEENLTKDYICLLQFAPFEEMFDCSMNFRIPKEDLINLNFENVIINMSCS